MLHLKSFNESNNDNEITEEDFELIENCFLDYIDGTFVGEFIPRSCDVQQRSSPVSIARQDSVQIRFGLPAPTDRQIKDLVYKIQGLTDEEFAMAPQGNLLGRAQIRYHINLSARYYLSMSWANGFLNEIAGDIKRCESYDFDCRFLFSHGFQDAEVETPYSEIFLIIHKKPLTNMSNKIENTYSLEAALAYTKDVMRDIETAYGID